MEFENPNKEKIEKKPDEVDYPNLHGVTDEYGECLAGEGIEGNTKENYYEGRHPRLATEYSDSAGRRLKSLKDIEDGSEGRSQGVTAEERIKELNERKEKKQEIFDVVTKEEIDDCKKIILDKFGVDLSDISINIIHPGETDFDHYEIQQNLFLKCNSDFDKMINLIKEYGYNPENLTTDQFKDIARKEGIALEGKYPSFAMTAGDDEIYFFGIKEENIIDMAKRFSEKEGEKEENISGIEDAKKFLGSLGKKYFLHEAGHVIYEKMVGYLQEEWEGYVEKHPELKEKIIEIQQDRYNDKEQIPVVKEAFADFFIDVASDKEGFSRLGKNTEATDKIREFLFATKEMQNNPYKNFMGKNNECKKIYPEEMKNLNAIAQNAGFKELLALEKVKNISCLDVSEDYCLFPSDGLKNQKLIEEIDKNFAEKGAFLIMQHEKQHFKNPAKKAADKSMEYPAEITMEEKNEKANEKAIKIENQVNLQTLSRNLELGNKEEIINNIITGTIYKDFIYDGIDALKEESKSDYYFKVYKFIDKDVVNEIVEEENKFKKELLKKYNELQKNKFDY